MSPETRTLTHDVELRAPVDAVWRALSEPDEMIRWFPLEARVEPGVGGRVWMSWGPGSEGESPITAWEPNRHLRTEMDTGTPVPFAVDYHLESRGGTTRLRVVSSGIGAGPEWDGMYDGMDGGWSYFLLNLRHYLERHPGTPRRVAYQRRPLQRDRADVWRALLAALGLPGDPRPGAPATVRLGPGDEVAGTVAMARAPGHLALHLPSLGDGLLFFELEPGGERWHLGVYLSTWDLPAGRADALQSRIGPMLDGITGPAAPPE